MSDLFFHYARYATAGCAMLTAAICLSLIFHKAYRNRIMRRLGLSIICFAGFARGLTIIDGHEYITPIGHALWVGLCLFFFSHVCSFIRHVHRQKNERASDHSATQIIYGEPK